MQAKLPIAITAISAVVALAVGARPSVARATVPCGDFGECKALIEINATDGDVGFHFLMDAEDLIAVELRDPNGGILFRGQAEGPLREQKLTETFAESAEPLCWEDPEADPDEEIVTLEQFVQRWPAGAYVVSGTAGGDEQPSGETELTHALPAAPSEVAFDRSVITWTGGTDLGRCASQSRLSELVASGVLPTHPRDVAVASWEIVVEPDVEDDDPRVQQVFTIRMPGDVEQRAVTVPAEYLASLPDDTPVKIEVGAIGDDDNATFTEVDGFCVNEREGCD